MSKSNISNFPFGFRGRPWARAELAANEKYPDIRGRVSFYNTCRGVMVEAQVTGLPCSDKPCQGRFFGFHIHGGSECSGEPPFENAGMHYNPHNCPHPYHAGDMPPLLGANGTAYLLFLTDSFTAEQIIGKTVIIHGSPDDFTTQPSGNSGEKLACGSICRYGRKNSFF